MNKKIISFWVIFISFFSVVFWYSLVFAWSLWEIKFKLSNNIFLDSIKLNQSKIIIKSREDLTNVNITWDCWINWKISDVDNNVYVFDIFVLDKSCDENKIVVNFEKDNLKLTTYFNPTNWYELYSDFLDYSDVKLKTRLKVIARGIEALSYYEEYNKESWDDFFEYLKNNRKLEELKYLESFISNILEKREEKYIVPINWSEISTQLNKLPNTWRPYRETYTDWVHHGWDIDSDFGDTVLSLDYGIVIRVVDEFSDYDFTRVNYSENLTELEKLKNLDILRGRQVWIKTMKWDVAFYSHLDTIFGNIEEWSFVSKGQPLWTVWISWVPDKNYSDYHLHLPVHKNPYLPKSNYTVDDYLQWDWYFKGKSSSYILENQNNIFE